ncbi:MAG TPA: guanine permease [Succinivibrionaceae bacterium]|nr:guanine permease [Succinivibrionaceae bacterium]
MSETENSAAQKSLLDKVFKLSKHNTSIQTEVIAGLTTFMAMAYIILVIPSMLVNAGIPVNAAVAATIFSTALCTFAMGIFANYPVALAPGIGLTAFFSFYVCGTQHLPWQTGLGAVFISGIVFFILSVTKLRQMIIDAVPATLKSAIVVGIGLFIAFIGLQSSGIVASSESTKVTLGNLADPSIALACLGLLLISVLLALKIRAAIIIGIAVVTAIGMILGISPHPTSLNEVVSFELPELGAVFLEMDIMGAINYGLISVVFTFTVVELFDNIGTLIAVTKSAGLVNKDGHIENLDRALLTDSVGTMASAVIGTSTVTSYIESAAGVHAGGKTGLTAVVISLCFLLAFLFTPLAAFVPAYATAPALIIVGSMMLRNVMQINFNDYSDSIPAFLTIIMMPLSYSIANGFGFGFTSYCVLKLFTGKAKEVTPVMWVIVIIFMCSFVMHLS